MVNLQDIKDRAKALLENGEVGAVVGFIESTAGNLASPKFITEADQADGLIWDPTCVHNLALYLVEERKRQTKAAHGHGAAPGGEDKSKRLAIVAKGCDTRAVNVLLQENYFPRDDIHVLGVSCEGTGMVDRYKLAKKLKGLQAEKTEFDGNGYKVTTTSGETVKVAAKDVMADRCLECRHPHPVIFDDEFGEAVEDRGLADAFAAIKTVDEGSTADKWKFWGHHFDRCIRCFACRSVCPMCYCEECVVDSINMHVLQDTSAEEKANRIKWIERSATTSENIGYHLVRAMHLAGRCVDCGECERVCPVNIPVRLLNSVLDFEAKDTFGYDVGMDPGQPSFVSSFRDDDPNDFIR